MYEYICIAFDYNRKNNKLIDMKIISMEFVYWANFY